MARVGAVAFCQLPDTSHMARAHPVFHVSLLKPAVGSHTVQNELTSYYLLFIYFQTILLESTNLPGTIRLRNRRVWINWIRVWSSLFSLVLCVLFLRISKVTLPAA